MRRTSLAIGLLYVGVSPLHAAITAFSASDQTGPGAGAGPGVIVATNSIQARNNFLASITGGVPGPFTFESEAIGTFAGSSRTFPGFTVTYSASTDATYNGVTNTADSQVLGWNTTAGGSRYLQSTSDTMGGSMTMTFNFASPINAWGAFFTDLESSAGTVRIFINDGSGLQVFTLPSRTSGDSLAFWGFASTGAVSSFTIEMQGSFGHRDVFGIDDIYSSARAPIVSSTPEPSVQLLGGAGLIALGLLRRRLK